ncbi:MAG: DUF4199 domain-containing protein [Bacteroidales bacterium]
MAQINQPSEPPKKENLFLKLTMTYGLITGLVLIVYTLLLYISNNLLEQNFILGVLNYIILVAGIIIGTKSYRDQYLGGYISYGKSLGTGVLISVFAGVVMGIFTYLLYAVIDPQLLDESIKIVQEEMLNKGVPEGQIEMMTEIQQKFQSPAVMMFSSIFSHGFMGLIFSLITSIFTKRDQPIFNQ